VKAGNPNPDAIDSNGVPKPDFKDILQNSNAEAALARQAKENGGDLAAETQEEFLEKLQKRNDPMANRKPSQEMDKDAFLKLFITQLQNQDPLNPDDSAKMAANLAQFQGLEQMTNVNKNLEKLSSEQALGRAVNLIDFVGKDIKVDGGKFKLANGKITDAKFELKEPVPGAVLQVRDASGSVIAKKDLGNLEKGRHRIAWDGKSEDGAKAINDGTYTFTIAAKNMQGQEVPVKISSTVKVTGVDLASQGGAFYSELGVIPVNQVASVGDEKFDAALEKAKAAAVSQPGTSEAGAQPQGNPAAGAQQQPSPPVTQAQNQDQPPPELVKQVMAQVAGQQP
jgi:flagellar basal-body rod modification protein FlgD